MRGSGTPEGCLSQAQLNKGKVSECARQSLLRECSIENWWESKQCTGFWWHVMFKFYSLQEDLLAPALLLVFSITLLTCKQVNFLQRNFFFLSDKGALKWLSTQTPDIILSTLYSLPFLKTFACVIYYSVIIYQLVIGTHSTCQAQHGWVVKKSCFNETIGLHYLVMAYKACQ